MITRISYEQVAERHPDELKELWHLIITKSKSKYRDRPIAEWKFAYDWHIPRMDGAYKAYRSYPKWTDDRIISKVVEQARNAIIHLTATPNPDGRSGTYMVILHELPDEVLGRILMDELKAEGTFKRMGGSDWKEMFARVRREIPVKKKPVKPQVKKEEQPVKRDKYAAIKV